MPKFCRGCGKELPDEDFYVRSPPLEKYLFSKCKPCHSKQSAANRRAALTGWSKEAYAEAVEQQGGKCYVCGGEPRGRGTLHADHNHANGKARKLLCSPCNVTLGNVRDSPALLRLLADYLEEHSDASI